MNFICKNLNKEKFKKEKLKSTKLLMNINKSLQNTLYNQYFSDYEKIVRVVGQILRFSYNSSNPKEKIKGELTSEEFHKAEMKVLWMI